MRPHNGWWKNTNTPRRWLDSMRAATPQPAPQEQASSAPVKAEPASA